MASARIDRATYTLFRRGNVGGVRCIVPVGNDALVAGWRGPRTAETEFGHGGAVSHSAHSEERTSLETPTMNCLRAWTDPFAGDGRPIWLPSSS